MSETQTQLKNCRYFGGGQWKDAEGGKTFEVQEPCSGKSFAHVASASRADAHAAVDGAVRAHAAWKISAT
jgi:succinate-semialdehyde dehydrogenase/glutarate-semialdehyde dehydrogenase